MWALQATRGTAQRRCRIEGVVQECGRFIAAMMASRSRLVHIFDGSVMYLSRGPPRPFVKGLEATPIDG